MCRQKIFRSKSRLKSLKTKLKNTTQIFINGRLKKHSIFLLSHIPANQGFRASLL